jgi:general secretion pathway protein H
MSATGEAAEAGSTLLEMLVVIGIMVLVAGVVYPNVLRPLERMPLLAARATLVADLRKARADSARLGRIVRVDLDEDGRGYQWNAAAVVLPSPVRLEADRRAVLFFADGSSSGGRLKLTGRGRALEVAVDPTTGVVAAGPG